jgi:CubicO group peptidase (beta-lactamase class C family)
MAVDTEVAMQLGRLHDTMAGYVERGEVPGLVTLVSHRGEAYVDAIGNNAAGSHDAMKRDTIFRISSMTKPITAAATMLLVEENKLGLDDSVEPLLPELAQRHVLTRLDGPIYETVPARRQITVRDLLTFRMGFGMLMGSPEQYPILKAANDLHIGMGPPRPQELPAGDEWLRRLGSLPLMYQPGERWLYDVPSDVLGILIARASGQCFETFLRERLFDPLGMKDTGFSVATAVEGRFATSYWTNRTTGNQEVYDEAIGGQWNQPPAFAAGGDGLVSTINDYFAFSQMILNYGRHGNLQLLSRAAVEMMTSDQLTSEQKKVSGFRPDYFAAHGWGFGMSVVTGENELGEPVGSFGWDGGLGTTWRADHGSGLNLILLTQCAWKAPEPPTITRDFLSSIYQVMRA